MGFQKSELMVVDLYTELCNLIEILIDYSELASLANCFSQTAKLLGFLLQVKEELHVCVLERACWCRSRVLLSEWWCLRVLLSERCALWSGHAGAGGGAMQR